MLIVISPDEEGEIGQLLKVGNIKDANDYTTYMSDNLKDYYLHWGDYNNYDCVKISSRYWLNGF